MEHEKNLKYFYNLLADENDKAVFEKLIEYKKSGMLNITQKQKSDYLKSREQFDSALIDNSVKILPSITRKLKFYNLLKFGYDIKIYGARAFLDKLIFMNQYNHSKCRIEKNDYVIDAGGCWGDTALIFAHIAGENGKIFSFEFFPESINIMKDNFSYNKKLAERIKITEKPVYEKSDIPLYLQMPCADITFLREEKIVYDNMFKTISIDDFIRQNNIEKIDFIKMDIEGCELSALKGAVDTIKKFRPKLAIAAYHKENDYYEIPKFINKLNLGYKFYFGTYTLKFSDTVIYASCK